MPGTAPRPRLVCRWMRRRLVFGASSVNWKLSAVPRTWRRPISPDIHKDEHRMNIRSHKTPAAVPEAIVGGLPVWKLLAFTMAGFLAIMTETMPAGLLPQISQGLGVSEALAGQLVTLYALGSVLAAIPIIAATRSWNRRPLLLLAIGGLLIFNSVTALSAHFGLILVARFVAGMAAGVIWGLLAGYARRMVPHRLQGRALAVASVVGHLVRLARRVLDHVGAVTAAVCLGASGGAGLRRTIRQTARTDPTHLPDAWHPPDTASAVCLDIGAQHSLHLHRPLPGLGGAGASGGRRAAVVRRSLHYGHLDHRRAGGPMATHTDPAESGRVHRRGADVGFLGRFGTGRATGRCDMGADLWRRTDIAANRAG